jgi:ubiquinone/menaquinone biosynthesis C-methylase UbiE
MMNVPASPAPEERFSDRVENYIRYRPGYPPEVIATLRGEALTPESIVADIGSGTGISAELFLREGCTVYAVEPNNEMRQAAERLLGKYPGFNSVAGTAQATTLANESADLVVAAQAFHWFDTPEARAEFTRILKPEGRVVLMWNERLIEATPFLREYEQLLLRFGTDYASVRHENTDAAKLARFFRGPFTSYSFPNVQSFDYQGLAGRLLSSSYAPAPGQPNHEPMMAELQQLFDKFNEAGTVRFEYRTQVYVGR